VVEFHVIPGQNLRLDFDGLDCLDFEGLDCHSCGLLCHHWTFLPSLDFSAITGLFCHHWTFILAVV